LLGRIEDIQEAEITGFEVNIVSVLLLYRI
jgi:hypothetical protein